MELRQFAMLRIVSLLLLGWSTLSLSRGVEKLLLVSDQGLWLSELFGPLLAIALALSLVVITSSLEAVHPLVDWLTSLALAAIPVLTRPNEPILWLVAILPLLFTRYGIDLIGKRSTNELRPSMHSAAAGLRPIILGLSLIFSLGFGLLTSEAITAGSLKLPPSLELQIERYLNPVKTSSAYLSLPGRLSVGEQLAGQAERLGVYVPITATVAYLIILLFVIGPILLQLSLWLAVGLRALLVALGWLTFKERAVRQEYAELE